MDKFADYDFLKFENYSNSDANGRIFILGSANGSGNLGDEAMFESLVGICNSLYPNLKITTDVSREPFESIYPNVDRKMPMYGSVENYRLYIKLSEYIGLKLFGIYFFKIWKYIFRKSEIIRYYEEFNACDCIIFSGAGAINSRFRSYGIYGWGTLTYLAKSMGKRVFFSGHGIGPFDSIIDRYFAIDFLKRANFIKCRDEISYTYLLNNGVKNVSWGVDDAYYTKTLNLEEKSQILEKNRMNTKFIVLSFHAWNKDFKFDYFFLVAKYILIHTDRDIILLGNKIKPTMNDIPILEEFKKKYFDKNDRVKVLIPPYSPQISKTLISNSDLLITTRYHPAIFSGEYKIPTVAISFDEYYYQKFVGAFANRSDVINIMYDEGVSEIPSLIKKEVDDLK